MIVLEHPQEISLVLSVDQTPAGLVAVPTPVGERLWRWAVTQGDEAHVEALGMQWERQVQEYK